MMEQETNLGIQEALPSMPRLPSAMAPGRLAKDRNEPWDMSWDIHYTLYIAATNELSCTPEAIAHETSSRVSLSSTISRQEQ